MKSIDWLLNELKIQKKVFFSSKKTRDIVETRWVAMWFYRLSGKSYLEIGRKIGRDHTTVMNGCAKISDSLKIFAESLFTRYKEEVCQEKVSFEPTPPPTTKKIIIKVPDYKHSKIILKEIEETLLPQSITQNWRAHGWNL